MLPQRSLIPVRLYAIRKSLTFIMPLPQGALSDDAVWRLFVWRL